MNTVFEIVAMSEDPENARAAAEAALDEISRIENLLSRFDLRSETSRINHHAALAPVLVDVEMGRLLALCLGYGRLTGGHFDISASVAEPAGNHSDWMITAPTRAFEFDEASRSIRLTRPGARLDFGAIGKGYALDRAAGILAENGITDALLHGGTSSVLAIGCGPGGRAWRVGLRDPFSETPDAEIGQVELSNQALSSSAALGICQTDSDLINPLTGRRLSQPIACVVVGTTGAETEALSTALLSMGKTGAEQFCRLSPGLNAQVGWVEPGNPGPKLEWLKESFDAKSA